MADYRLLQGFKGVGGAMKESEDRALQNQMVQLKMAQSLSGSDLPAAVQEYKYFNELDPQSQQKYLQMKRADKIIDTGAGFARFDPITGQAIPVGASSAGGAPLVKTLDPEEQRKADLAAREEQDKFRRALDVQEKALAITEKLVGRPNPETKQLEGGNISGVRAVSGSLGRFLPNIRSSSYDAQTDIENLTNLLTTENLGLLKGVLSDTDMKVLASIGSGELKGSDKKVLGALRRMREALEKKTTGMRGVESTLTTGQIPPNPSEFIDYPVDSDINTILNTGLQPVKPQSSKLKSIPMKAVQYLRANPQAAADFDAKYGAGASKMVLGR